MMQLAMCALLTRQSVSRYFKAWMMWAVTFLCACSVAVPALPVQELQAPTPAPGVLVIRPTGDQPIQLTRDEFEQGMRMLWRQGSPPGAPKGGHPRFMLASSDPVAAAKAAGYL